MQSELRQKITQLAGYFVATHISSATIWLSLSFKFAFFIGFYFAYVGFYYSFRFKKKNYNMAIYLNHDKNIFKKFCLNNINFLMYNFSSLTFYSLILLRSAKEEKTNILVCNFKLIFSIWPVILLSFIFLFTSIAYVINCRVLYVNKSSWSFSHFIK